ncbi:MAG: hypothetical protein JG776_2281 [Caloramator sp.]|jgi:hypothetical protein|nr:hypothetical protein [Caloramator sp.]
MPIKRRGNYMFVIFRICLALYLARRVYENTERA